MNESVVQTVGVVKTPTIDEINELVEKMRELAPACWHYDLVTSEWLPKSDQGIVYACVRCSKKFVVPASIFGDGKPPERLSIDPFAGMSFRTEASKGCGY